MDTVCLCGHDRTDHTRRTGACQGRDSYDSPCACPAWVPDDSCPDPDDPDAG